jgi:hypothetical protein
MTTDQRPPEAEEDKQEREPLRWPDRIGLVHGE